MKTIDLQRTIIQAFKNKEFYGYDIHKKLKTLGVDIEIGRLYKVLNQMQKDNWLEARWEKSSSGPKKKVYKIGKKGKTELDNLLIKAIRTIHRSYGEYLFSLSEQKDIFAKISKSIAEKIQKKGNFALIAMTPSPMYQKLIEKIQNIKKVSKIFIVKPKKTQIEIKNLKTTNIEGNYENIPFKDKYIDLLFITSIPKNESIEKSAREWLRVINNGGKVAILSPNVLFGNLQDPLTIGDFIEKWEHQIYEGRKTGGGEILLSNLKKYFQKIEEKDIVHMKLVLASNPIK